MTRIERTSSNQIKNGLLFLIIGLTYFISPILTLILSFITIIKYKKSSVILALLIGFSIAYPALFYVPLLTDDATRIFHVVDAFKDVQWNYLFTWLQTWAQDYLNYPTFTLLMYIVSHVLKPTFLSFIVAGISYAIICYTVCEFTSFFKIPNVIKALTIVASLMWISFLELISGMRFVLASSFVLLIVLNLFILRKNVKHIFLLWFLIPISIHPGVLLIIIPTVLLWLIREQSNSLVKAIIILLSVLFVVIILSGQNFQNQYVTMLLNRINIYQNITYDYVTSPQKVFHLFLAILVSLISILFLYRSTSNDTALNNAFYKLFTLNKLYFFYYLILIFSINLDMRLMMVMPIMGILGITAKTSEYLQNNLKWGYIVIILLLLLSISGAVYNISALKINFEPINWLFPNYNLIQ